MKGTHVCAKSLQSCLALCDSMDCSPPGSSVHGILQARILEWVAMPSSRGIFLTQGLNPSVLCLLHWQTSSLPLAPPGKPSCRVRDAPGTQGRTGKVPRKRSSGGQRYPLGSLLCDG